MAKNSQNIVFSLYLPDFKKQDIQVKVSKNKALVHAHRTMEKKVHRDGFIHEEKIANKYYYSTTLPAVDYTNVKTEFKDGTLTIHVPKKQN